MTSVSISIPQPVESIYNRTRQYEHQQNGTTINISECGLIRDERMHKEGWDDKYLKPD